MNNNRGKSTLFLQLLLGGMCVFTPVAAAAVPAVIPAESPAPAKRLTLNLKNVKLQKVINAIESQTDYLFVINDKVDVNKKVTVNIKNGTVGEVLKAALAGTGINYDLEGTHIILSTGKLGSTSADTKVQDATRRTITGEVLDESGDPIIGATVKVAGVPDGTMTNVDGKFSIQGNDASVVEISFIGLLPQKVTVGNKSDLKITLREDSKKLDEVVVIGYTTQRKGLLTGSVATMKMNDRLKTIPTTSTGNLLAGKLAGVNVSTPADIPGSDPGISIRTGSSWNAQAVTYVIDGVVRGSGDFNALSPNEIEDITVLKDAASAAIYGSRSAGGVIIVTTKKGDIGKPSINYSYSYGFDSRTKNSELTSAIETGELYNRINGEADPAAWRWSQEELEHFRNINGGWGYDQLDAVWKNPTTQTHNFSISGGSEKIKYFGAASYVRQTGFMKPLKYDKYNLRLNVTAEVTKDLELFTGLAIYNNYQNNMVFEGPYSAYSKLRLWQPDQPVYTNNGEFVDYGWIANIGAVVDGAAGYSRNQYLKPQAVISATYRVPFLKGLSAKVSYSRSWANDINSTYNTNYKMAVMPRTGASGHIISTNDDEILYWKNSSNGREYLQKTSNWSGDKQFNVQINYDNTFNDVHRVSGALVTEWYEGNGAGVWGYRQDFPVYRTDQFWAASSSSENTNGGGATDWTNGRMSYIGQFNYTYDSKYLVNFSFREDGSMNFAPGKRWGFFPAGSVGWVMSREGFFEGLTNSISFFKLRASVGLTGNDSVGGWQWQESYRSGSSAYFGEGGSRLTGITYGSVVNKNLTWEKALSYNFGVDVNFLNHWNASVDYWYRNSYDILGNRQNTLPTTFSLSMPAENYGKIHAQGVDLEVGYNGASHDFTYFGRLTASYGWNKVIRRDYAENAQYVDIPVGKSMNYITGYKFDRIIRTQEELDAFNREHPDYNFGGIKPELGQMVYQDVSGPEGKPDGIINSWDRVILHRRNNPVVLGINLGGTWKGFSVDMMLNGSIGHKKWVYDLCEGVEWNRMWRPWYNDSWTPENPNASLPKRKNVDARKTYDEYTDFWLKDASFLRLKYLTVSYTLPKGQFYNKVFENIRFYMSGTNLFVLSKFNNDYYDPEIGGGNAYPVMRTISFGVDVKF